MPGMRLIAGSGRSGTTWVQDALASANNLRPVFEPLHPAVSDIGSRYAYRALSADEEHPELERFLTEVCAGGRHVMWTRYRGRTDLLFPPLSKLTTVDSAKRMYRRWRKFLNDMPELAAAGRRSNPLVKCIRANLMLAWLSRRCGCKTVLVVRHPGAVVESQDRSGTWSAEPALRRYRGDSRLHEMTGGRYRALLERPLSGVQAHAANWVIENQWAMEQAADNGVTVVLYERLRSSPDREWQRMCQALDLPNIPDSLVRGRPSQQTYTDRSVAIQDTASEPRWLHSLSREQVGLIQEVLDQAQVGLYNMSDPEPRDTTDCAVSMRSMGILP